MKKKIESDKAEKFLDTKEGCEEFVYFLEMAKFAFQELVDRVGVEDATGLFLTLPLPLRGGIDKSWAARGWLDYIAKDQIKRLRK